jgi:hypothetical protein
LKKEEKLKELEDLEKGIDLPAYSGETLDDLKPETDLKKLI